MEVYLRGIPNFGFVVAQETENLPGFLNALELRVGLGIFEAKADYYLNKKRVMVYLERDDYFREIQLPANLYLRVSPEDGRVTGAGTGGCVGGDDCRLYVDPKNYPRYPSILAEARKAAQIRQAREREEEERLEYLRERLINLAEHIGIKEAIETLESIARPNKG